MFTMVARTRFPVFHVQLTALHLDEATTKQTFPLVNSIVSPALPDFRGCIGWPLVVIQARSHLNCAPTTKAHTAAQTFSHGPSSLFGFFRFLACPSIRL